MNKQTAITIGGQERKLVFGLTGFYDHIQSALKSDPLEYLQKFKEKDPVMTRDDMIIFIHAGLNSAIDLEGGINVDFEHVKQWYRTIPADDIDSVHSKVLAAIAGDEQGEVKSQQDHGSN